MTTEAGPGAAKSTPHPATPPLLVMQIESTHKARRSPGRSFLFLVLVIFLLVGIIQILDREVNHLDRVLNFDDGRNRGFVSPRL